MDRWVIGIIATFVILIGAYVAFFWLAAQNPIEIEPSYQQEAR